MQLWALCLGGSNIFRNIWGLSLFFLVLFSINTEATTLKSGVPDSLIKENTPSHNELYRILLENTNNGTIKVSMDKGITWKNIGKVILPTKKVNRRGYTASRWSKIGTLGATAVNAIHVKTGHNAKLDRGIIFSILPKEQLKPRKGYTSYLSPNSSIYTNIEGGSLIFGGEYAPYVGNKFYLLQDNNLTAPTHNYVPKIGDRIIIKVTLPHPYPKEIIFENRFGGLIYMKYYYIERNPKVIGQVLRPVLGVGRFLGTHYTAKGRVRANHSGVIGISTSPYGKIGGFQIIPANHAMSPEMIYARKLTQWMVVAPINAKDPSMEGVAPLFSSYLSPRYNKDDIKKDNWRQLFRERARVEAKYKGKTGWHPLPTYWLYLHKKLPDEAFTVLKDITHIKILFPLFDKRTLSNAG